MTEQEEVSFLNQLTSARRELEALGRMSPEAIEDELDRRFCPDGKPPRRPLKKMAVKLWAVIVLDNELLGVFSTLERANEAIAGSPKLKDWADAGYVEPEEVELDAWAGNKKDTPGTRVPQGA